MGRRAIREKGVGNTHAHTRTHTSQAPHTHGVTRQKEGRGKGRGEEGTANGHAQRTNGRSAGSRHGQPYLVLLRLFSKLAKL